MQQARTAGTVELVKCAKRYIDSAGHEQHLAKKSVEPFTV